MVHICDPFRFNSWSWYMAPDAERPTTEAETSPQTPADPPQAHEPETDIGKKLAEALRGADMGEDVEEGERPGALDLPPPWPDKPEEDEDSDGKTTPKRRAWPKDPRDFDPDEHPFPHEHGLNPDLEYKMDVLIAQQHRLVQQGEMVNQGMGCLVGLLLGLFLLLANIAQLLNALQALLGWMVGMLAFLAVQWLRFLRAWQGPPPRWWPRLQYAWWRARWMDYWRPWTWASLVGFIVGLGGMTFALGLVGGQEGPIPPTPTPTAQDMMVPATEATVVEPTSTVTSEPALPPTEAAPPTATASPTSMPTSTPTPVEITANLTYAHTQPGVYSQVFLTITGPPETPYQFTLSGPGVTGQRTFSGVLNQTGKATLVWRIATYGRYTAQGFIGEESITRSVQVRP